MAAVMGYLGMPVGAAGIFCMPGMSNPALCTAIVSVATVGAVGIHSFIRHLVLHNESETGSVFCHDRKCRSLTLVLQNAIFIGPSWRLVVACSERFVCRMFAERPVPKATRTPPARSYSKQISLAQCGNRGVGLLRWSTASRCHAAAAPSLRIGLKHHGSWRLSHGTREVRLRALATGRVRTCRSHASSPGEQVDLHPSARRASRPLPGRCP
jgi:hypothetical protein